MAGKVRKKGLWDKNRRAFSHVHCSNTAMLGLMYIQGNPVNPNASTRILMATVSCGSNELTHQEKLLGSFKTWPE